MGHFTSPQCWLGILSITVPCKAFFVCLTSIQQAYVLSALLVQSCVVLGLLSTVVRRVFFKYSIQLEFCWFFSDMHLPSEL